MSLFYKDGRLKMLYGNHDIVKKKSQYIKRHLDKCYCIQEKRFVPLLENIDVVESYVLENVDNKTEIFLLHGHQGSVINDIWWRLGRFLVRNIWSPLELVGFTNLGTSPADNYQAAKKNEKIEKWCISPDKCGRLTVHREKL